MLRLALLLTLLAAPAAQAKVTIKTVSNRADLVSGGDVRVVVHGAGKVFAGKRNVTKVFARTGKHTREGVVTGLKVGRTVLRVKRTRLTVTNHPQGGPIFAGPQIQPWKCQAGATDAQCNQAPTFAYVYKSTDRTKKGLQPYDPKAPPGDVAYVARVETGYQDRDQYKVAARVDPATLKPAINHKLLVTHGASCDVDYATGSAPSVTSYNPADVADTPVSAGADSAQFALGQGYIVMSTALDNSGHNCDVVTQAESLLMAKEHVIETYGRLRYTIGTGCSGGSLAQQWIANAYPGIYQGILPTCSFPDTWSSATQVMDYHLLRAYFEDPSKWGPGVVWSPTQFGAVEGNLLPIDAVVSDIGFFSAIVPTHDCDGVPDDQRYDPATRPNGVRCAISDLAVNVFGPRGPSVWGASEKTVGHGFAGIAVDNVGVQYGLAALQSGAILPSQFVDLNRRIGGLDVDITPTPKRIAADRPALARAYRSGMINEANNLDRTAIIDCRGPDPGAAHDSYRAFAVRARLDREHGSHANQLIWEGPAPLIGDTDCGQNSLIAMDRWLAAVRKDRSKTPVAAKLVKDKPAGLGDECYDGAGTKVADGLCGEAVVPVYGTPRTAAGDAITTDANKCQLKPLARADYPITLTDADFAELKTVFPDGVCDFSKPGVDQQPTVPWLRYGSAKQVIYGGRPMKRAPVSHRR